MTLDPSTESVEGLAVIGMSGCFPGAKNLDQFWKNLCAGVESIRFFSEEEHQQPGWADPDAHYVRAKGVLDEAELFDAGFFGYTPEEAVGMDPQHRLFLERGWEAIESAGYDAESYPGAIGVYAGVSANTYLLTSMFANPKAGRGWLSDKDFVTTRLSYKLNLRGPSVVVQSACSTSLVAVCMACQSLLTYQCDMALAGGATVWAPTNFGYPHHLGGPLSPDGHCRAFDASAGGFVPGSGVGAVLLKRLSEAVEEGDNILAVIRGFAINNDGSAKIGYTAPSIDGQAEVIAMAQALASINPETISYIEAHGTGTDLGDPIEVAALTQAFRASTQKKGFCALGSVKSNIGHLDAAAGIASLIKVVLALQHKQIPPSLHYERPNPKIDFDSTPFYVNSQLRAWEPTGSPLRAGASAFGIGGTNSHVVLEEAPPTEPSDPARPTQLLLLSARSAKGLDAAAHNLADHLALNPQIDLADVAYTLQVGRKRFAHRRLLVCRDAESAGDALRSPAGRLEARQDDRTTRPVVFLFPGQGSQFPGMARDVYEQEAVFRETVDRCCRTLHPELDLDLRKVLFPEADDPRAAERLTQTSLTQPALFVIEYALAQLLMSWGIRPVACIGHSIGEYVAACLAEVFTLDDALKVVAARARLMNGMPRGAMLAVHGREEDVLPCLSKEVSLAAVNAPGLCVLSGPDEAVARVSEQLRHQGLTVTKLHTSHAFHSAMMEPMLAQFERIVAGVPRQEPKIPYLSNLTGTWIEKSQPTEPAYWSRHLRQTVRFSAGLQVLLEDPERALLEVGPGRTLTSLAQTHSTCGPSRVVSATLRHPQDTRSDLECLLHGVGQLWMGGATVDWSTFHAPHRRRRGALPTYPFERQRYWACDEVSDSGLGLRALPAAASRNAPDERFFVPSWKRTPLPVAGQADNRLAPGRTWLLLLDRQGIGQRLCDQVRATGAAAMTVEVGTGFEQLDEHRYRIDPDSREDYVRLMQSLVERNRAPETIVNLLAVTGADPAEDGVGRRGFYSLLYLAQSLADVGVDTPVCLVAVTDDAQAVTGQERLIPEKALVQGPCRVLPQEMSNVSCRHIDLTSTDAVSISDLVAEIASESSGAVVAYRGGYRWTQCFERHALPQPAESDHPRLRQQGAYLITGGLGGMGLVLAGWLAEAVQAKLVLTSRTALPSRDDWETWLAGHEADDASSRKIRAVQSLESHGAEVLLVAADTCDETQMRNVVELAEQRFGPLRGVVHAAGISDRGLAQLKTEEMAEKVFAAKVDGLRVLQRVLGARPLDFLALCSSIAAISGGIAQIDYCAANAFMDAVAWKNRAAGGPFTVSINWNTWSEAGMSVEAQMPAQLKELGRRLGREDSSSNAEGVEAFRRILAHCREPQVAVSMIDLPESLRRQQQSRWSDELSLLDQAAPTMHPRPELQTAYSGPETGTERATAEVWQALFGFERIGRDDDFFELGGHSLLAMQLLERLRTRFGVHLTLAVLFEHKTIASLAERIDAAQWGAAAEPAAADGPREEFTL